jgi:hypothetical protein
MRNSRATLVLPTQGLLLSEIEKKELIESLSTISISELLNATTPKVQPIRPANDSYVIKVFKSAFINMTNNKQATIK